MSDGLTDVAACLEQPLASALREETPVQQQIMAELAEIWEPCKETIAKQVAVLEQGAMALLEGTLDDELRCQAVCEAHKLAGSVGTFGFTEGARLAREIEHLLQAGGTLEQTHALRLSELVMALLKELERPLTLSPALARVPEDTRPLLLVVDNDRELGEQLVVEATARGIRTELAPNLTVARQAITRARPHLVLLEISCAATAEETSEAGLTLLAELTAQTPPIPVMVITAHDTFVDRVEVARLGGRGFLHKPMPPAQILEAVTALLAQARIATTHILAVDDDPQVLAVYWAAHQALYQAKEAGCNRILPAGWRLD
jgi:DNA-binding response OmpR family regulator